MWRRAILTATLGSLLPCAALAQSDLIFADGFETSSPPHLQLVINEVDYDQADIDTQEFIEIFNPGPAVVPLTDLSLVLFNGADNLSYETIDLGPAGTLDAGQYVVVASSTVIVAPTALTILFPAATNNVQNGPPDGLALIDQTACIVIDAFSYEGPVTAAVVPPPCAGTVSLVEGNALSAAVADSNIVPASLIRFPDGSDSDDAATDWTITTTPSPGSANGKTP